MRNQQLESTNNMKALEERINKMQLNFDQKLEDIIATFKAIPMEEDTPTKSVTSMKQDSAVTKYKVCKCILVP